MAFDIYSVAPAELLKLVKKEGGQRAFARKHGIARTTLQDRLYSLRKKPFSHRPAPKAKRVGDKREIRRFILTSAQDSTVLHEQFLTNLEAYREWLQTHGSCEIMVGGYTYNKSLFEDNDKRGVNWPERIKPYIRNERIRIADKIDFCAEQNTLPTASKPLSGFETYTQDRWGIFPHAKVQLVSVPTMQHQPCKQLLTTGSCTLPNYVMKKAGIKASFHHIIGAVLVEVDREGAFFCRHLLADEKGSFYDLDRHVEMGKVTTGHQLDVLTPGDVHEDQIDPVAAEAIFAVSGKDVEKSIIGALKPRHLFLHDLLDFLRRNHHNLLDPHFRFKMHSQATDSVEEEVWKVAMFLNIIEVNFPDVDKHVVDSNHDQALKTWLRTGDYRYDPVNAIIFLKCHLAVYEAIKRGDEDFSILEHIIKKEMSCAENVDFLREDKTPIVIGGVEHSNHGHRGPNGSRGGVASLSRVSSKMTVGHVHSPAILDGLCAAGTTSRMDLSYNKGPSSWAHSLVAQYQNGKRTIITLQGKKWCVEIP